jgi:hypothetical protein
VNQVYGTVDRVHGRGSPRSTGFIKSWLSVLGSTAQIKSIDGVSTPLIVVVVSGLEDGRLQPRKATAQLARGGGAIEL